MSGVERFIPAVRWLRRYERRFIARDLAAGLAVGSMLIPQGLAFAQIVEIPPVAGLWSGIAAMAAYALFGPSRHLIVGPEAGTAMMVAAVLTSAGIQSPDHRLGAAALVALMVAAALVVAGLFRLGAIADFLSRPILVGYINGVALVLIASQLPGVLGIRSTQTEFVPQVLDIGSRLGSVHGPTVWLSAGALVFLLALRRSLPKLPGAVVVVAAGIVLSALLDLEAHGGEVLEELDREFDERGITLALAEPHAPMRRVLRRTGLLRNIGPENIFSTVGESIRAYVERAEAELGEDVDWRRADEPPRPSGGAP